MYDLVKRFCIKRIPPPAGVGNVQGDVKGVSEMLQQGNRSSKKETECSGDLVGRDKRQDCQWGVIQSREEEAVVPIGETS